MDPLPEDHDFKVAMRLLTQETGLDLKILHALMGRPKRYSELRPLIAGKNDNVLTKALHRLYAEGAVQTGLTGDLKAKTYVLSPIGQYVIFHAHEMMPHHLSIVAYNRGLPT